MMNFTKFLIILQFLRYISHDFTENLLFYVILLSNLHCFQDIFVCIVIHETIFLLHEPIAHSPLGCNFIAPLWLMSLSDSILKFLIFGHFTRWNILANVKTTLALNELKMTFCSTTGTY